MSFRNIHHALIIRSPVARGSIKEIKCPKLPSSYSLITAEQIPGKNQLADFSVPVLAGKNLMYIGEPVAILTGPELSKLEELLSKIELDVEEEKPVFSYPSEAQGEGFPEGQTPILADVLVSRNISAGDPDKIFGEAKKVVSGAYSTGIQEHWYSETHGAVAEPASSVRHGQISGKAKKPTAPEPVFLAGKDNDNRENLRIYTATQWPHHVKRSVAGVLGLDSETVTVNPTLVSFHLDGKIWYPSLVACHAALAAWISGSPVMLMLTKVEDFLYSPKRNGAEIEISSALGEKGEILCSKLQVKLNLGAEAVFEDEIMDHTCLGALGVYNHRSFKISGAGMRTNIPPQGPMAGFGLSQGFFAAERHISRIADALGQDPAEWRKNNFLDKNQTLGTGTALKDPPPLAELIDTVAAMSDYHRKWASYELLRNRRRGQKINFIGEPLRGIGISTAYQGNGFLNKIDAVNNCTVELTLEKDGSLEIKTSLISSGTGYIVNWQNMAQKILGVDPALIRLTNDTKKAPDSGPGTLSRNIGVLTRLVELCCNAILKQRFRDPLPITVKRSSRPIKDPGWVQEKIVDHEAFARPGWGAVVVEIEIDSVSLEPAIRGVWFAADGGKILSQHRASLALRTGITTALGWTCREKLYYRDGKIPYALYQGYNFYAPAEIPPITVDFIPNENSSPKGIGDLPFCCVPAAYVQAVSQALDYPFEKIPLGTQDIWDTGKIDKPGSAI